MEIPVPFISAAIGYIYKLCGTMGKARELFQPPMHAFYFIGLRGNLS